MNIYSNTLDINKFKKDFSRLYWNCSLMKIDGDKEQLLERIVKLIEESGYSISSFLKKVDSIEEKKIQRYCRHASVAQMYNAGIDYQTTENSRYVESCGYGEALLVQLHPKNTVVISKYGEILINEGELWTHSGLNYGEGWTIRKIIDGQVSDKHGFINNDGARVLPCVFDYIKGHIDTHTKINFGHLCFDLHVYENIDSIGRDELQDMIEQYDQRNFYCLSEDNILFILSFNKYERPIYINGAIAIKNNKHDTSNSEELLEELKSLLSPMIISKERLQEIAMSK